MAKTISWQIKREALTSKRLLLFIVILGIIIRAWTIFTPRRDFDEPTFLELAQAYAGYIEKGEWDQIPQYTGVQEHPALVKLLFTIAVLVTKSADPWVTFVVARSISALFGVLTIGLLGMINPIGAGFIAFHTMEIKYTSEIYLDAVAQFVSLGAVLAFTRSLKIDKWFLLSAFAIGITAASKYTYFPAFLAICFLAYQQRRPLFHYVLYYFLGGIVFLAFDPTLWPNPPLRLWESLTFHTLYAQSTHVQQSDFPWYQPFVWLIGPAAYYPHRLIYFGFDWLPFVLSILGLPLQWQRRRWAVIWYLTGIIALLLWPSKWPQYPMIILVPLCLSAGDIVLELLKRTHLLLSINSTRLPYIKLQTNVGTETITPEFFILEICISKSSILEHLKRFFIFPNT